MLKRVASHALFGCMLVAASACHRSKAKREVARVEAKHAGPVARTLSPAERMRIIGPRTRTWAATVGSTVPNAVSFSVAGGTLRISAIDTEPNGGFWMKWTNGARHQEFNYFNDGRFAYGVGDADRSRSEAGVVVRINGTAQTDWKKRGDELIRKLSATTRQRRH